ncbi:MAG: hypothetical protein JNL60_07280, partial [Bacteroidia bacterium]|nr:hypothetical protein [Bacteroidia bacterium]
SIAGINFGTIVLLSRSGGAEFKGLCTQIAALASVAQIASEIGGGAVIVKMAQNKRVVKLFLFNLAIITILSLITATYAINTTHELRLLSLTFLVCAFASLTSFIGYYCLSKQAIHIYNLINFSQPFVMLIILMLYKNSLSFSVFMFSFAISYAVSFLIGILYFIIQAKKDANLEELKYNEISRHSLIAIASHFGGFVTQRLLYFILPFFILGVFSNAISVAESALIVANSLCTYLFSKLSSIDDLKQQVSLTKSYIKINLAVLLFGYVLILFIPAGFYVFFFGDDFSEVGNIMKYAFPGVIFNSVHLIIGHFFSSKANFKINLFFTLTGFVGTLLFTILFALNKELLNLYSAAIMYSGSYFLVFLVAVYSFIKQSRVVHE